MALLLAAAVGMCATPQKHTKHSKRKTRVVVVDKSDQAAIDRAIVRTLRE